MKISVRIKPNAKHREEVVPEEGGVLLIYTKEPAIEGRANKAAIKLLAEHLNVSRNQVQLLRGHTSKYKIFEISK